MSILLIGDPHFKEDNALESEQLINETLRVIEEDLSIEFVIILGDILDTHEKIYMKPFCRATRFIQEIAVLKPVFVLIGNHDRINNDVFLTKDHAFNALKGTKNVTIVDEVIKQDGFVFVPYVPTGDFKDALDTLPGCMDGSKAIFAHQEFRGAKMGAIVSEKGDPWDYDEYTCPVFSGHIHQYQELEKITYLGTPFQHAFSDNDDKGLFILDKEDLSLQKININIIKKRSQEIFIGDLLNYQVDDKYLTKIIIRGTDKHILKYLDNPKITNIINHPRIYYKIKYISDDGADNKYLLEKEVDNFHYYLQNIIDTCSDKVKDIFQTISGS